MELMKINEITEKYGVSSRTLRYYEQTGLLQSIRPPFERYRFYDNENINRLKQILVLRKMQLPIKDILRIYENQDMETLVKSFVRRVEEIEGEINALSQLKAYINDFLEAMIAHGFTHISALPLLYEKVEAKTISATRQDLTLEVLNDISDKLVKPLEMDIVVLPAMQVITSINTESKKSELDQLWDWLSARQFPFGKPGSRTLFEYQDGDEVVLMQMLSSQREELNNQKTSEDSCPFECTEFRGGLFAVSSAYTDEDLGALQEGMIRGFDDNPNFEVDYLHNGNLRHNTLIESVFSPDHHRERVNLYLPVRRRKLRASYYPEFERRESISLREVEEANPVLYEYIVDFHKITPLYSPHFRIMENGEAEFIAWISERMLDTNVAVRLPFRMDMEFLAEEESEKYLWGTTEGSLWFSHGGCTFTVNGENQADPALKKHTLSFQQPLVENEYSYPQIGDIPLNQYNRLTWIVGEKHFAVFLNEEVRFCATKFPYMSMNLHLLTPQTVIIGTNGQGKKLFRSIKISQLKVSPKTIIKQGVLKMKQKQSNNILPELRQIVHPEFGQNYWFNGCAAYVMECLGERDYDYWFFTGLTGDSFTQIYSKDIFRGSGALDYCLSEKGKHSHVEEIFRHCGYASTFVPLKQILSNREMYVQLLVSYIDKGVPVILNDYGNNPHNRFSWGVLVGYEDYGKSLLYLGGDATEPDLISVEDLLPKGYTEEGEHCHGWLFIGEKQESRSLDKIYRDRILSLVEMLRYENEHYGFGSKAFYTWAERIKNGYFEHVEPDQFDSWALHTVYVCCLATNVGGSRSFLEKALELNPDMTFITEIMKLYEKTGHYWQDDNGTDLEAMGGGFNVTLEALQDNSRRKRIADKLRSFARCIEEVTAVIERFKTESPLSQ